MLIATWNVNSVRARLERLLAWLEKWRPDVVCLQEVKTPEAKFPFAEVEACGYRAAVYGQKGYLLAVTALAGRCREVTVDREERKGPSPSDHAPVLASGLADQTIKKLPSKRRAAWQRKYS